MQMTVGVPGHVPGFDAATIPLWARRVEELGFDALSVSDRPSWTTPEPLTSLAAAAAVTERIGLLTSVVVAPPHVNAGLFATAAATIDRLAGAGRLRLGLTPGARPRDYDGAPVDFAHRGRAFDTGSTGGLTPTEVADFVDRLSRSFETAGRTDRPHESAGADELILTPNDPDPDTLLSLRRHLMVTV